MTTGVRWLSVGPGSGYGNASEDYLSGLREAGVPVSWTPIGWPSSTWDAPLGPVTDFAWHRLDGAAHLDIANRKIDHDVVVVCSTPLWHDQLAIEADGRRLVAYTTWETDRVWSEWVRILNRYDRVLVPSHFNAEVFESSGLEVPLAVVPHIAQPQLSMATATAPRVPDRFVFYMIASWTTRKAIPDAVSAFLDAFTADDDVELVIHTTPEDLTARARRANGGSPGANSDSTWFTLARELADRAAVPRITLSTRWLSRSAVDDLHRRGDCFLSLSRGEGWGLGAFDAGASGNPVIVTGWGGTLDFLPPDYPYCIEYDLVPTLTDPPDVWWGPRPEERWAKARVAHASALLRQVFDHRDDARSVGRRLQREIQACYSGTSVTSRLIEALS